MQSVVFMLRVSYSIFYATYFDIDQNSNVEVP